MTGKILSLLLLVSMVAATPMVWAADGEGGSREATGAGVTQGELAQILVNVLSLSRALPVAPSMQEVLTALVHNNIYPMTEEWEPDSIVTRGDLAKLVVLSMKHGDEVENPEDPRAWIAYLESIGISIATIGEAVDNLAPLPEAVAQNVFIVAATTDPLKKHAKFAQPDEAEFGTDVEFEPHMLPVSFALIFEVVEQAHVPAKKPPPVTRD